MKRETKPEWWFEIPKGKSGRWRVSHEVIAKRDEEFMRLRAMMNPHRPEEMARVIPAGTYTYLRCEGETVMSDTPAELADLEPLRENARGKIMIAGLGLGCAVALAASLDAVKSITVVESSPDVYALVLPTLKRVLREKRIVYCLDSIFDWRPVRGERFDFAWYDIWNAYGEEIIEEGAILRRRFKRYVKKQMCWAEEISSRYVRKEREG